MVQTTVQFPPTYTLSRCVTVCTGGPITRGWRRHRPRRDTTHPTDSSIPSLMHAWLAAPSQHYSIPIVVYPTSCCAYTIPDNAAVAIRIVAATATAVDSPQLSIQVLLREVPIASSQIIPTKCSWLIGCYRGPLSGYRFDDNERETEKVPGLTDYALLKGPHQQATAADALTTT